MVRLRPTIRAVRDRRQSFQQKNLGNLTRIWRTEASLSGGKHRKQMGGFEADATPAVIKGAGCGQTLSVLFAR
jgi:hypothetical protein